MNDARWQLADLRRALASRPYVVDVEADLRVAMLRLRESVVATPFTLVELAECYTECLHSKPLLRTEAERLYREAVQYAIDHNIAPWSAALRLAAQENSLSRAMMGGAPKIPRLKDLSDGPEAD